MKFRNYTNGEFSKILGKPYLEYELYFESQEKDKYISCKYNIVDGKK